MTLYKKLNLLFDLFLVILTSGILSTSHVSCALLSNIDANKEVVFFFAADTHISDNEDTHQINIDLINAMNNLPGTAYPKDIPGTVNEPIGILIAGDLTENSNQTEWEKFLAIFDSIDNDGLSRYPVYESIGNHDVNEDKMNVIDGVVERHGNTFYSMDWGPVHIVCLGYHPDTENLEWLAKDLARIGQTRPIIIYFHMNIVYQWIDDGIEQFKDLFLAVIKDYNVIGIFNGHSHNVKRSNWKGYDVYISGSPTKQIDNRIGFHVVSVTRDYMSVAFWQINNNDQEQGCWNESFTEAKTIPSHPPPRL